GKAQRQPNLAAGDSVPVGSLTFAGYTTPEAAFQSSLSAVAKGDMKTFLEGFTLERRQQEEKDVAGKSEADLAERAAHFATSTVRLLDTRKISDDEARLIVFLTADDRSVALTMR